MMVIQGVEGRSLTMVLVFGMVKLVTTQHQYQAQVVYSLWPGDGEGDSETRLSLQLHEALGPSGPPSLPSFTLCVWLQVTAFLDDSTILSYALSSENDDALRFRLSNEHLQVKYQGHVLDIPKGYFVFSPLTWHSLCVALAPSQWSVWVDGDTLTQAANNSPLPLNGSLVLGQDQDIIDGGYTKQQSFLGQLTELTLWQGVLQPHQLREWSICSVYDASDLLTPLLNWTDFSWTLHNGTGALQYYAEGPCNQENEKRENIFLFTLRMLPEEAYTYLFKYDLQLMIPRNYEEVKTISTLLKNNHIQCPINIKGGYGTWVGIKQDIISGKIINFEGVEIYNELLRQRVKTWRNLTYFLQDATDEWHVMAGLTRQCFIGRQHGKTVVFKLLGLPNEKTYSAQNKVPSFVVASDPNNGVYFHGYRQMHIKKVNNSQWCLNGRDPSHEVACITSVGPPVGRHMWHMKKTVNGDSTPNLVSLSLSRCSEHEYTCSDATCVDLDKMCNFKFDCFDRSDEVGCATALLPREYLHTYPPAAPLPVLASILVERLSKFNILSMSFHISLKIKISWRDSLVTFAHLSLVTSREVVTENGREIWQPQLVISNSPGDDVSRTMLRVFREGEGKPTVEGYRYGGSENPLVATVTMRSMVYCDYQLRWYPWDEQRCTVKLRVSNVGERGLIVNESSLVSEYPRLLEEYRVVECRLLSHTTTTQPTDSLWIYLHLARRFEYHLWTTFLPTSLLLGLGYGTLLLPVELFNERGIMSLTTLLVFISLYTDTNTSLPSTAYLKYIDVWFVFSLTYLSLIISVHLATFPANPQTSNSTSHAPSFRPSVISPMGRKLRSRGAWFHSVSKSKCRFFCHRAGSKQTTSRFFTPEKNLRAMRYILAPVLIIFTIVYALALLE